MHSSTIAFSDKRNGKTKSGSHFRVPSPRSTATLQEQVNCYIEMKLIYSQAIACEAIFGFGLLEFGLRRGFPLAHNRHAYAGHMIVPEHDSAHIRARGKYPEYSLGPSF